MARAWLLALAVVAFGGLPALAHGTWLDARPLPGVTVGGTVDEVAFLFGEPLQLGQGEVTVVGPDGRPHPGGAIEHPAETVVRMPIQPLAEEG
ncbi:MAG: hypothetical protein R3246_09130, partial [Acidimicrobiia bacterium]|nr:hypothetical protein [Acidimicrobiia bacterium]